MLFITFYHFFFIVWLDSLRSICLTMWARFVHAECQKTCEVIRAKPINLATYLRVGLYTRTLENIAFAYLFYHLYLSFHLPSTSMQAFPFHRCRRVCSRWIPWFLVQHRYKSGTSIYSALLCVQFLLCDMIKRIFPWFMTLMLYDLLWFYFFLQFQRKSLTIHWWMRTSKRV